MFYKFVSVCLDPKTRLCNGTDKLTKNLDVEIYAVYGEPYELNCSGSGAPYLDLIWKKDADTLINDHIFTTYSYSNADHHVSSQLKIPRISAENIGKYRCIISNKNFGNRITKTYFMKSNFSNQSNEINQRINNLTIGGISGGALLFLTVVISTVCFIRHRKVLSSAEDNTPGNLHSNMIYNSNIAESPANPYPSRDEGVEDDGIYEDLDQLHEGMSVI